MLCQHCASTMPTSKILLGAWAVEYGQLIATRHLKPKTLADRLAHIAQLVPMLGGLDRPLASIRPVDMAQAIRAVWDSGRQHLALRLYIEADGMFNEAIIAGYAGLNPVTHLKRPRPIVRRSRLTIEQLRAIRKRTLRSGKQWLADAIDIALVSGLRIGDIVRLRPNHVVEGHLLVTQQKTGVRQAIPLELRLTSERLSLGTVIERCTAGKGDDALLICRRSGKPYSPTYLTTAFSNERDLALPESAWADGKKPATLHEIRSLCERLYREQGQDTRALLGHKRQSTTDLYNDDRECAGAVFKVVALPGRKKGVTHIRSAVQG
ncbi:tyrosine-type recombinase/integrase [Pseudomonas sp.]|uniref:tyrosine-type recombinase/integrase n=1 Tax=Pseudomonas sp. TaxID=306 RepID=UPI00258E1078|nr:tyrosine-type recombinase/integrase [Pseudomonas sp.]